MISTVTISTISTISNALIAGSVALIAILALLGLLVQKELASASSSPRLKTLSKVLNIGIVPLLMVFFVVIAVRVAIILR